MYTIKTLAQVLQIPVSTIRYYEKKGLLTAKRAPNNYRQFTEADRDQLSLILVMKYAGFSLAETKDMLSFTGLSQASCASETQKLILQKKAALLRKIDNYKTIVQLLDTVGPLAVTSDTPEAEARLSQKINDIFQNL